MSSALLYEYITIHYKDVLLVTSTVGRVAGSILGGRGFFDFCMESVPTQHLEEFVVVTAV